MEKKKKKEESCSIKLLTLSGGAEGPEGSLNNIALPVHDFLFFFVPFLQILEGGEECVKKQV